VAMADPPAIKIAAKGCGAMAVRRWYDAQGVSIGARQEHESETSRAGAGLVTSTNGLRAGILGTLAVDETVTCFQSGTNDRAGDHA